MKETLRHILWNQLLDRYRGNQDFWNEGLTENIETLLFHPEIEYIQQGFELLHSLGSEQLCRYLRKRHGQLLIEPPREKKRSNFFFLECLILEFVMEEEDWRPLYRSGLFKRMEYRVLANIGYPELPKPQKKRALDASLEMVLIPAGEFWMGTHKDDLEGYKNEKPRHRVRISRDYYIGKYLVTQALWESVMGKNPNYLKGATQPVYKVNWYECIEFCNRLSVQQGKEPVYSINGTDISCYWGADGYRLPTEAEWEYAARGRGGIFSSAKARPEGGTVGWEYAARGPAAGTQVTSAKDPLYAARANSEFKYSGSDDPTEVGWYRANSNGRQILSIGRKKPNSYGLYDMSGNVCEWCWDLMNSEEYRHRSRQRSIIVDPRGATRSYPKDLRVMRGGCWIDNARELRVSSRSYNRASSRTSGYFSITGSVGLRLVRNA